MPVGEDSITIRTVVKCGSRLTSAQFRELRCVPSMLLRIRG